MFESPQNLTYKKYYLKIDQNLTELNILYFMSIQHSEFINQSFYA